MNTTKSVKIFALKAKITLHLAILLSVAAFGQTTEIGQDFEKSYTVAIIPEGATIHNLSGQQLYLLNERQYVPLYDLWMMAKDTVAFFGRFDLEFYSLLQGYMFEQDSLLSGLEMANYQAKELQIEANQGRKKDMEELRRLLANLDQQNKDATATAGNLDNTLNKAAKKMKKGFWPTLRDLGIGGIVGGGVVAILLSNRN